MENLNPLGIQSVQQFSTMYSLFIYTSPEKTQKPQAAPNQAVATARTSSYSRNGHSKSKV